jgi:uncharacterized tellurite resistance protein B-like protein
MKRGILSPMLASIKRFFDLNLAAATESGTPEQQEHAYQLATAALMIEMTRADHEVKSVERDAVTRAVQRVFGLDSEETAELVALAEQQADEATSLYEFTRLINDNFEPQQKEHIVELLWQVALADGDIDKYEDHLVRKVADLIHVPHPTFIRANHTPNSRMQPA